MSTPSSSLLNSIQKGFIFFSVLLTAIGACVYCVLPKAFNMPLAEIGSATYKQASMPPKVQNFNREIAKQEAAKKLAMAKAAQSQKKLTPVQKEAAKQAAAAKAAQKQAAKIQQVANQKKSQR